MSSASCPLLSLQWPLNQNWTLEKNNYFKFKYYDYLYELSKARQSLGDEVLDLK